MPDHGTESGHVLLSQKRVNVAYKFLVSLISRIGSMKLHNCMQPKKSKNRIILTDLEV